MNRKGISPVIATVIIVAVAIAIAIAVAFWMTGIVGLFTRFEKIEVTNAWADWDSDSGTWTVIVQLKNTGTADATLVDVLINGKPARSYSGVTVQYTYALVSNPSEITENFNFDNGVPLKSGDAMTILITIDPSNAPFKHGQSIEVKIHTAAGQDYPKMVNLP